MLTAARVANTADYHSPPLSFFADDAQQVDAPTTHIPEKRPPRGCPSRRERPAAAA